MTQQLVPKLVTPEQAQVVASTLASAFVNDPMIAWPMSDQFGIDECRQLFSVIVESYVELGILWQLDDGAAAAALFDPDAAARFGEYDAQMRPLINVLTDDDGARYAQFWDWIAGHIGDKPVWFLDMLAVRPERQGLGLGSALLQHAVGLAEQQAMPLFLETSQQQNVGYYERFGFDVVDQGTSPQGGPHIWFMRRKPSR